MVTFALSGLWHGAKYTFIIWGILHGVLLTKEKIIQKYFPKFKWFPFFVFILVMLCWVPFRAPNTHEMEHAYYTLLCMDFSWGNFIYKNNLHNISITVVFVFFILFERWLNKSTFYEKMNVIPKFSRWVFYYFIIICILLYGDFNNAPSFIYFQF